MNVQKILIVAFLVGCFTLETSAAAVGGPFKCGNLECPNASICEIKQTPNDDNKTETITKRCLDIDGTVLSEETIVEDVPEGKIPFSSVKRTTVSGDASGAHYGSSYAAKSIASVGGKDGTPIIDFIPLDAKAEPEFVFKMDKIWSFVDKQLDIVKEATKDFVEGLFGKCD